MIMIDREDLSVEVFFCSQRAAENPGGVGLRSHVISMLGS